MRIASVVDSVAGTTRDPVDSLVTLGGVTWRFIDTAGIRRRVREASGAEYYSSLRTATALREAEVAVVLLDASEPLAEQDLRIIEMVVEAGRALVLAFNKWDIVDEDRHDLLEKEIDRQLHHVAWAPRVNVSAKTGRAIDKLTPAIELALDGWSQRIATSKLNAWLSALIAATPPPVRGGRQPKVLFATQAGTQPPRFVLFSSGFLEATYRRFIERRLREDFGFPGTPVEVAVRVKESRKGRPRGVRNRAGRTCNRASSRSREGGRGGCDIVGPASGTERRDVAQLGSALDWGSRGRRFKSCHPDAYRRISAIRPGKSA